MPQHWVQARAGGADQRLGLSVIYNAPDNDRYDKVGRSLMIMISGRRRHAGATTRRGGGELPETPFQEKISNRGNSLGNSLGNSSLPPSRLLFKS